MKAKWNLSRVAMVVAALVMFAATASEPTAVHYVNANSKKPKRPYNSWQKAARTIQDAVRVATAGDRIMVTNGTYAGGIIVTQALALRSVNGPRFTTIDGGRARRCITLADGASLTGFTVTNALMSYSGAGVFCASTNVFLTNCVIAGNTALGRWQLVSIWPPYPPWPPRPGYWPPWRPPVVNYIPSYGGGVYRGTLYGCVIEHNSATYGGGAYNSKLCNCMVVSNSAPGGSFLVYGSLRYVSSSGGGAGACTLFNCTVSGNSATGGGGISSGASYNCILYFNSAQTNQNYSPSAVLNYCCTTPLPTNGIGNIIIEPGFANATTGDFHLQVDSPCINAGNNSYATESCDLDVCPRIMGGTVDIGAYEYQGTP